MTFSEYEICLDSCNETDLDCMTECLSEYLDQFFVDTASANIQRYALLSTDSSYDETPLSEAT